MDAMLQKHGAKHVYKVPEGLRELCMDISREVLRSQPRDIHGFIAEYMDTLLITRENTKVAVKVVNNILLGSQAILNILYRTGLNLEQIAVAAPRIQRAFKEYLDAVDGRATGEFDESCDCDEESMFSIREILEATGASRENAERAATVIQAAFRGHRERMAMNEARGEVQWQRAVMNTLDILRKAGASQAEISKAAKLVQYAYRGYYTRRNRKMDIPIEPPEGAGKRDRKVEPTETIQAVAWLEMLYEDSGLTVQKANEAAIVIQRAYQRYRVRKSAYNVQRVESAKSMLVEGILENVRSKLFEKVMSREDIPEEYGTREEMMAEGSELRRVFKDRLRRARISGEGSVESEEDGEDESQERGETEEADSPEAEDFSGKLEVNFEEKQTEGQSTEPGANDRRVSGLETASEHQLENHLQSGSFENPSAHAPHEPINAETLATQGKEREEEVTPVVNEEEELTAGVRGVEGEDEEEKIAGEAVTSSV